MNINFRQQIVAVVATVLVSTACLVGAVGPATGAGSMGGQTHTVASRLI